MPNRPGAHTFTVTGTDAEGNVGTATHGYVVFEDIGGPITNHSVFSAGRVDPDHPRARRTPTGTVFANGYPLVRKVHCATGEVLAEQSASVQSNLSNNGRLMVQWRTEAGWGGSCRSLVIRLGLGGWSGADAVFTVRFA